MRSEGVGHVLVSIDSVNGDDVTSLGQISIMRNGGTAEKGNYLCTFVRGKTQHLIQVEGFQRQGKSAFDLVRFVLNRCAKQI